MIVYSQLVNKRISDVLNGSEKNKNYDENLITSSLARVGKGAGVLFFGTILGIILNFLARVIIARFYNAADYGLFNLFFTILSLFVGIGILGLGAGVSRFIGYYTGSGEKDKIKAVESWGLFIGLFNGIIFGIILFFIAPWISQLFSDKTIFIEYIKIAAFTLPFYILLSSLSSSIR